jgi:type IV pilus assembly protein PilF
MKYDRQAFVIALLIGALSGCAQQTVEQGLLTNTDADRAFLSAKIHTELAAEYFYRGQLDVAIEEVNEALKAQSNYAPAYSVMGLINMSLNENDKALSNFERAIRLAPRNSEILNNYGWFLCQRYPERIGQAIDHFVTAARDPLYATPERSYANAGVCETKRERYAEAQLFFQRSLLIQPNFPPAVIGMIEIDFQRGNLIDAKSKLTQFLQNNSSTSDGLLLAIKVEQALGNQLAVDSYIFQLQKHFPDSREAALIREGAIR